MRIAAIAKRTLMASSILTAAAGYADAQNFNQFVVFGDSNVDSGFYRALPNPAAAQPSTRFWAAAVAAGAGAPTSRPGLMSSEALAAMFGLTAIPSNQPGGTNYATSGAKNVTVNDATTGGFQQAITNGQPGRQLPRGRRRPRQRQRALSDQFRRQRRLLRTRQFRSRSVSRRSDGLSCRRRQQPRRRRRPVAGRRRALLHRPEPAVLLSDGRRRRQRRNAGCAAALQHGAVVGLAASGVNFIPADWNSVRVAIAANPSAFGFQFVGTGAGQVACTNLPASFGMGAVVLVQSRRAVDVRDARCGSHAPVRGRPAHDDGRNENPGRLLLQPRRRTESDLVPRRSAGEDPHRRDRGDPEPGSDLAKSTRRVRLQRLDHRRRIAPEDRQLSGISRRSRDAGRRIGRSSTTRCRRIGWLAARSRSAIPGSRTAPSDISRRTSSRPASTPRTAMARSGASIVGTAGLLRDDVNRAVPIGITVQPNNATVNGTNLSLAGGDRLQFRERTVHARPAGRDGAATGACPQLHRNRQLHQPVVRRSGPQLGRRPHRLPGHVRRRRVPAVREGGLES